MVFDFMGMFRPEHAPVHRHLKKSHRPVHPVLVCASPFQTQAEAFVCVDARVPYAASSSLLERFELT